MNAEEHAPPTIESFRKLRTLRHYEDLVRPAIDALRNALGRPLNRQDLDALYVALRAYQATENTHQKISTAVQTATAESALEALVVPGPTDATYRAVAALQAASSLVGDSLDACTVRDVLDSPTELGALSTELADTYLEWLDEQAAR